MEKVVNFELKFRGGYILSAEFILKFNQFVLKLNTHFSLIVKVILKLILGFLELFTLVFQHKLKFCEVMVIVLV